MFGHLHAVKTLLFSANLLFSFLPVLGQTVASNDRMHRVQARPGAQIVRQTGSKPLPFDTSVIIYYGTPGRATKASAVPVSDTAVATPGAVTPTKSIPKTKVPISTTATQGPRTDIHQDLQPVLIYYRAGSVAKLSNAKAPVEKIVPDEISIIKTVSNHAAPLSGEAIKDSDPEIGSAAREAFKDIAVATITTETLIRSQNEIVGDAHLPESEMPDQPHADLVSPAISDISASNRQEINAPEPASEKTQTLIPVSSLTFPQKELSDSARVVNGERTVSGAAAKANPPLETTNLSIKAVDLNNTAVGLTAETKYAEAEALLEEAIAAQPTVAKFHRNLSIVFERMGNFDEALASARIAAKLAPSDPSVLEQLCLLEVDKGIAANAVGCYEKLDSIQPLDALLQTCYGASLFKSGRVDESIEVLEKAARSTPPLAVSLNALGVAYFTKKREKDAVEAFKNAVEADPEMLEFRYNLAIAELAQRNKTAALSQYAILKQGDPKLADQLYRVLFRDKVISVEDLKSH